MGCDIHGFVRARYSKTSPWHFISRVPHARNYALFALLAGVRNYDNVICVPNAQASSTG